MSTSTNPRPPYAPRNVWQVALRVAGVLSPVSPQEVCDALCGAPLPLPFLREVARVLAQQQDLVVLHQARPAIVIT